MQPRARVLVVDDDKRFLGILADFLTSRGYEAVTAENVEDAFKLIDDAARAVVLLVIRMPGLDGVTPLHRFLNRPHDSPVIVMHTATPDFKVARHTVMSGAFDCLVEPFDFNDIATVIGRAVAFYRGRLG